MKKLFASIAMAAVAYAAHPYHGYYSYSWDGGSKGYQGANSGIAFTGFVNVQDAIDAYDFDDPWCCPDLKKPMLLSLGGWWPDGIFNERTLSAINSDAMDKIKKAGYSGIVYFVEQLQGNTGKMIGLFANSFKAAYDAKLSVIVTTPHSGPKWGGPLGK